MNFQLAGTNGIGRAYFFYIILIEYIEFIYLGILNSLRRFTKSADNYKK